MSPSLSNTNLGRSLRAPASFSAEVGGPPPRHSPEGPGVAGASGGCCGCCAGCCLGVVLLFVTVAALLLLTLRAYLRRTAIGNDAAEQGKKGGRLLVEYLERKADAEAEAGRR